MEDNLSNRIYKARFPERNDFTVPVDLTDQEKEEYALMITKGCRANTKATIRRLVEVPLSLWSDHGIYKRVGCGQEWNSEMRTLRDCLLGKFD